MFQRMCAVAMFVAALFISVIPNADARQDIYAFTYNGNNWYVDRDSIDRNKPDGLLHFTVYTMIGLRYDVASGSEYYNADVYYYDQKIVYRRWSVIISQSRYLGGGSCGTSTTGCA